MLYVVVGTVFCVAGLTLATEAVRTRIQESDPVADFIGRFIRGRVILIGVALGALGAMLLWFWLTR
jgi:hypothetical protein